MLYTKWYLNFALTLFYHISIVLFNIVQYALDLRKPDLGKNLDLRKIVATTDFFST